VTPDESWVVESTTGSRVSTEEYFRTLLANVQRGVMRRKTVGSWLAFSASTQPTISKRPHFRPMMDD